MFGYKDFSKNVQIVFDESFCTKYGFSIVEQKESAVTLKSKECKLVIWIDGLIVDADFLKPNADFLDNEYYSISLYLEFKNVKTNPLNFNKDFSDVREKLQELRNQIETFCENILRGDFSWQNELEVYLKGRWE